MEKIAAPIMEHLVPNAKMAAAYHQWHDAVKDSDGDATALDHQIQHIWDSIDDHFGELSTDNLWWSKSTKDITGLLLLARGWTFGNTRMYYGGAADLVNSMHSGFTTGNFKLTNRTMFVAGSFVALTYTNALYQGLHSVAPDVEGLGYLYPRDGTRDADGHFNLINPLAPEYDPINYAHDPFGTLFHKASPAVATAAELLQNKNYSGHEVTDPSDGSLVAGAKRIAFAVKRNALPISFTNYAEGADHGQGRPGKFLEEQAGFHSSPKWVGQSPAERLASTYYKQQQSDAPMDDDAFEKMQTAVQTQADYVNGKITMQDVADRVNSGQLPAKFIDKLLSGGTQNSFQRQVSRIMQTSTEQA